MLRVVKGTRKLAITCVVATSLLAVNAPLLPGQISPSAYRALGQSDLQQNTVNRVQGAELASPAAVALDARFGTVRLYVSDTDNNRVLGWADVGAYQAGEAAAVILGQPTARQTGPLGIGEAGLRQPAGIAVDPRNGNLYVADSGNHRVLRFASPFANPGRAEPDAVYGQDDFTTRSANGPGLGRASLNNPQAVALDPSGNLWIADTGNHRVVRFPSAILDDFRPSADVVIGQRDFAQNVRNRGAATISSSSLDAPAGLAFDSAGNLYVSDSGNARVLKFSSSPVMDASATGVFGQPDFATHDVTRDVARVIAGPAGLTVGANGMLYVAVPGQNRVAVFELTGTPGAAAVNVLGQPDLTTTGANSGTAPRAAGSTLASPMDVKSNAAGDIFIADTRNNRVLRVPAGSRSAAQVWGQPDLTANGVNQVKPASLFAPYRVTIDYSQAPFALYVSDTNNNRILVWKDAVRFRSGDPADLVIGQPDLWTGVANVDATGRRTTRTSLSGPRGIAVDGWGNLYVADTGNHRVLRYPRPVSQSGAIVSDIVLGQTDFNASGSGATSPGSLRSPTAVAIGPDGGIFISDTGNNRVLEFAAGAPTGSPAFRVYGQPNFYSSTTHGAVSAQTLIQPQGIAVDTSFNLYVADTGANRVLIFPNTRDAAFTAHAASIVIGSDRFDAIPAAASSATRFGSPVDVALDSAARVYVSDGRNHRVLIFPSLIFLPIVDGAAIKAVGQRDLTANARNGGSTDALATSDGLAGPAGIFVDRLDTLYVADGGNNRILHFLKTATFHHAANAQASSLARGGLVTVEGESLATSEGTSQAPLGVTLAMREVVINDDMRVPLLSVAPDKITLQLPWSAPTGAPRMAVRAADTGELIAGTASVPVATYAPGLFARVLNQDGTENSQASGAAKASTIRLYGTGQGPVSPFVAEGEAAGEGSARTVAVPTADGSTCVSNQPSVCVAIGAAFGEIQFSGLAAGQVGTWQMDVKLPISAPAGDVPVRAVINGVPSNIIRVWVK